jgi:hypothetical protein
MAHGFNDWNVVPEHSNRIYQAVKEKGVPAQIYYHQGGHGGQPPAKMMNRWFAHYLHGVENDVQEGPRAWIVRENDDKAKPTSYEDYPNPAASPVTFHLVAGSPERGQLSTDPQPDQGTETLDDNFSFDGAALAQADWTNHRLIYLTSELTEAVHLSGTPSITIKLASSKPAVNLSVWLVSLPWNKSRNAKITDNIITRGWADPQNHRCLTESEPLVPGQFYEMTFDLQPDDQIIPKGQQIGLMIFSSDRDFTLHPDPGTELTVDLDATSLVLPVVGGAEAFAKAIQEKAEEPAGRESAETPSDRWFSVASELVHEEAFAGAHDVELSGDLAFVPGKKGAIAVVDIADPKQPELLWFRQDMETFSDSETVLPVGKHLLLGTRDFHSLDVSDPKNPSILKTISDRDRIDRINGMVKRGDHVFAASKAGWIDVFDISDIGFPTLFGALEVREQHDLRTPHDIDAFDDYVVVVDPVRFSGPVGKLAIFKVRDPKGQLLPVDQWKLEGLVEGEELIGANRVQVSGSFAVTAGSWTPSARKEQDADVSPCMGVVDISNPRKPRIVASVPFSDFRGPNGLTIAGKLVFLAGGHTIEAVDISDPRSPVKLGSQKLNELSDEQDNAHDLVYRDGYLYVSCQTENRFMILKVNDKRIRKLASHN